MHIHLWSRLENRQPSWQLAYLWRCHLLATIAILFWACSPLQLSPITVPPTGQHHPGQVIWHDLLTSDVDSAKHFYGQLFGWTFEQDGRYTLILNEGVPIAGIVFDKRTKKQLERAWWLVYLSITDIDETAEWVAGAGGKVIKGPSKMTNRGRYAMIKDPQGAPLVLLHSTSGDPVPADPVMNGWLWNELWALDTETALEFYQFLGSYAADLVSPAESEDAYWILVSGQRWQAGITTIPFEKLPPQWVPAVRVANPTAVADRAASLGGRVLIWPDHPLGAGHLSLIEDPSGGLIMVESWETDDLPTKEQ